MKIGNIDNRIDDIQDDNVKSIISLITDAVRDYPYFGLDDLDEYFTDVKRLLQNREINSTNLKFFLQNGLSKNNSENDIWTYNSISALSEAFALMKFHNIDFNDVLITLKSIGYCQRDQNS